MDAAAAAALKASRGSNRKTEKIKPEEEKVTEIRRISAETDEMYERKLQNSSTDRHEETNRDALIWLLVIIWIHQHQKKLHDNRIHSK